MKALRRRVTPFLILSILPASTGINLYSAEIKAVTIRNNKVKINLEKAKKIVFEHSKVHSNNVRLTKLILEKENKKYIYAIEFYYRNKKYKYNVDANTGRIIAHSSSERLVSDSYWNIMLPAPAPIPESNNPDGTAAIASNDTTVRKEANNYYAKSAEKEKMWKI